MPKVSVIIPVYNTEPYLKRCLNSVCNQTLKDIEIILVDDCSTDESLKILKEYASKDKRIKLIILEQNQGVAVARNKGLEAAKGEYIGFVDSDDFIDLNFYETLYKKAEEDDFDAVKGNIRKYDSKTNEYSKDIFLDMNSYIRKNKAYFHCSFYTAIYKTEFVRKNHLHFLEGFIFFQDPYFTIKAALFYKKLALVDDVFYNYCNNSEQVTKNLSLKHIKSEIEASEIILDLLKENKAEKEHYIIVARYLIRQLIYKCRTVVYSDNITKLASDGLIGLMEKCMYPKDVLCLYFNLEKEYEKKNICAQLRNNVVRIKND